MLFDCVQDCYDNGTADKLDKWGHPVRFGYRRGKQYDLGAKDIARLCDHLTGVDDDARAGYPTESIKGRPGTPTREPEYIAVIGFLESFRTADDFCAKWMDDHSDELLDIIEAKVEYIKTHPPKIGTVDPARVVLKRKGKSAAETQAEGRPTKAGPSLLAEGDELSSPRTILTRKRMPPPKVSGRKPMSEEARKAAGERLRAAREKKKADGTGSTSLREGDAVTADAKG